MNFFNAPITWLTDLLTTDPELRVLFARQQSTIGKLALDLARAEIGKGETEGNNRGPDIERWRDGVGAGSAQSWCGAFLYTQLADSANTLGKKLFKRTHWARGIFRKSVKQGMLVAFNDIQPGDIVLFGRGKKGSDQGHIGIVSRVIRGALGNVIGWYYIAGNEGPFPSLVDEFDGERRERLIGFARI